MLRPILQSDLAQLCTLEAITQIAPWPQETFERCFLAGSQGWAIVQPADQMIGFILVLMQLNECHILNIGVAPRLQRQGHGSRLLAHALIEAKRQGAEVVYLEVRCSNKNAIALYEKMGFSKVGERKDYYSAAEGREDAWVFAKRIE